MAKMLIFMVTVLLLLIGAFIISPFIIGLLFLVEIIADMFSKPKR